MSEPSSTDIVRWTEVRVAVPRGWQELVADALSREPFTSVVFGRTSVGMEPAPDGCDWLRTYVVDEDDTPELRAALNRQLADLCRSAGAEELARLAPHFKPLPPEDWATSWRKTWKPFRLGRLCVVPPWLDYAPRPGEVRLELEPGGAFGSGRHATTRACLRAIQERLEPGARVLDAGSGSGILSVTAALFGASAVLGFDIDRTARRYADALAIANGVAERCTFRTGGFETLADTDTGFDAVLANIYSDVLQGHAHDLAQRMRPGAWFVFSGCPERHVPSTRTAIEKAGLSVEGEEVRGRWMTFVGTRPGG